jgi:hypothetical protein
LASQKPPGAGEGEWHGDRKGEQIERELDVLGVAEHLE